MDITRLLARLDIKGPNLIKGVHLEGLRVVGDPHLYAKRYYEEGIDEIIFMDAVASLYGRNSLKEIVRATAAELFIPMTVGGGIRSVDDVRDMLRCGADKVAINTAAVARPELITEVAQRFGSQCMVLQVDAKRTPRGGWEAYTDGGREHTGLEVIEWVRRGVELGAGEILLTSVDCEGARKGFDLELTRAVADSVSVPVIACGGCGEDGHISDVVHVGHADAVAVAGALHFGRVSVAAMRQAIVEGVAA
ncbi:MAG: imidazole glycerol phosphate synthase cyclase subunit [Thermodesulfobacteriota bacterium]